MPYYKNLVGIALGVALSLPELASAQVTPGMGGPGGFGGPQQPAGEEKKEGIAEAAPKQPGLLPTTPALPTAKGRRKRWKLFEMDGYYRMRTDWFKNFNLGFNDDPTLGGAPFPRALGCTSQALNHPCDDSLASANMRLRLEPTLNLDEGTSVHVQADVLDNLVLGSTPTNQQFNGAYTDMNKPPLGAFGNTQDPPVKGVNSDRESIVVKRAWAEVAVPLGILKFGRMPNHWGMGIWANGGGRDPINGTYNYDADNGDTVDRLSFSALIPGTPLRAMVAMDWDMTRLVSNQLVATNKGHESHPFDLDDSSDTNGWTAVVSKMDSPQEFRDIVDRGELALNYGAYFEYKTQSWDADLTGFNGSTFDSSTHYVPRDLKTYTPDLWVKLGYGSVQLEGEFVAQLGRVDRLDDYQHQTDANGSSGADIRKYGGVGRFTWSGLENKLKLGVEAGFASGDQYDNTPQGNTNIAYANLLGESNTTRLTQFIFNRDYFVDLILFRHLIGAVTNAAYGKPFLSYDLTKSLTFKVSNISSFALKPVSTPGNGVMYGTEFDGELGFNSGGLHASIAYGVLFPFGAMAHPEDVDGAGGPGFHYGTDLVTMVPNVGDPGTAHTIQMRVVLAF